MKVSNDHHHQHAGDWATPLGMSLAAGMSTCLGAAVVFCTKRKMGHRHLSFALSLAGSVMITVSIASILPEAFQDDKNKSNPNMYVPIRSIAFLQRCTAFAIGCALYVLLSRLAFPDPDTILGLDDTTKPEGSDSNDKDEPVLPTVPLKSSVSAVRRNRGAAVTTTPEKGAAALLPTYSANNNNNNNNKSNDDDAAQPLLEAKVSSNNKSMDANVYCSKLSKGDDLTTSEARRAWRVAMLLFVSLAVHNFPEGLAVAASTMHSQHLGWTTTIAIALHNIPEGVAIAIPCLAARPDSPWLAFMLASLSGLAEPMGAIVALSVLDRTDGSDGNGNETLVAGETRTMMSFLVSTMFDMHNVLAFVAGIMIMVAVVELFPEAKRHMKDDVAPGIAGTMIGMIVMLASDAFLEE